MKCRAKRVGRKLRKLIRDPRGFLEDAVENYASGRERASWVADDRSQLAGRRADFSVDALLKELATRFPLLYTVDDVEFKIGILSAHVLGIVQEFEDFAARHQGELRIAVGTAEYVTGRPAYLTSALRTSSSFRISIWSERYRLVDIEFFVYVNRAGTLRCDAPILLSHIPRTASAMLLAGNAGSHWPSTLLGSRHPPSEPNEEVDIVYTWVNADDVRWRQLYEEQYGVPPDPDRYSSRDELRYSMRSVHYYCGWVRRIHVVSNCSPPEWLDLTHQNVTWVEHSEILDPNNLPTFNCHAIETGLMNVPGLSDRFVYFNDDFFVLNPLRPRAFFDDLGRSIGFLERMGQLAADRSKCEESWFEARLTTQKMLLERYGYAATRVACHAPYAVNRTVCRGMFNEFPNEVERVAASRQRAADDIPLISFMYPHYAAATGAGLVRYPKTQTLNSGTMAGFKLNEGATFLCINDGGGSAEDRRFSSLAEKTMKGRFPHAAPWEKA